MSAIPDEIYEYIDRNGTKWDMVFRKGEYAIDGSIYLGMFCRDADDEEYWEDYGDATVFIDVLDDPYKVCLDTNNLGDAILDWLVERGFATYTGKRLQSGFCEYPVVELSAEWVESLRGVDEE